ncbi:MAG: hypothetical protein RL687_216 [Candidatus Parcubacteria bacterium]|jgi:hypothetical protein
MEIENIEVAIFHRRDSTKIEAAIHSENSYNLGKKEIDDNFRIEFNSLSGQKFLIFHENKHGHYENLEEETDGKILTKISFHRKLILVTIKSGGIANQYDLEIKHENHESLFCFSHIKQIKIFLHSNGIPDSKEIDRNRNHFFLQAIFFLMDEAELTKI